MVRSRQGRSLPQCVLKSCWQPQDTAERSKQQRRRGGGGRRKGMETRCRQGWEGPAGGQVLSREQEGGGYGGCRGGGGAEPQNSPAEARSSSGVKILRPPPPRAGGALETTMASRGTGAGLGEQSCP